jgi:hypothetical protein
MWGFSFCSKTSVTYNGILMTIVIMNLVWRGPTNIQNPSTGEKKIKINLEYKNIRFIFVLLNQYYYEI